MRSKDPISVTYLVIRAVEVSHSSLPNPSVVGDELRQAVWDKSDELLQKELDAKDKAIPVVLGLPGEEISLESQADWIELAKKHLAEIVGLVDGMEYLARLLPQTKDSLQNLRRNVGNLRDLIDRLTSPKDIKKFNQKKGRR